MIFNGLDYGDALPHGMHYYLVGEPAQMQKDWGVHLTELGPYATREEARDALPLYLVLIAAELEPWDWKDATFRVVGVEVGEALEPTHGEVVVAVNSNYLEKAVAGGFADADQVAWIYNVVSDHAAARLAYLDDELLMTLPIVVQEDYVFEPGETVWMRITSVERLMPAADGSQSPPIR